MGVSKVEFGGETLIDLTGDSVTPNTMFAGTTAHNSAGEQIEGDVMTLGGTTEQISSSVAILVPYSDFGDAQPSDVKAGKIFTSSAGLKAVGTGEIGGSSLDEAEVNLQAELIAEIKETAESLPDAGGGESAEFDYVALWDEMLGDVYTEVGGGDAYDENGELIGTYDPTSVLARESYNGRCVLVPQDVQSSGYTSDYFDLIVIPRSITSIGEFAFENAPFCVVVCLAPTPPALGFQGYWSVDGGSSPPIAIYVPDESVDLYKGDTTWAEYMDAIVPLSTFDYSTAFDYSG